MACCLSLYKHNLGPKSLSDKITKAVQLHDTKGLRKLTRKYTIEEFINALGYEEKLDISGKVHYQQNPKPLIIKWTPETFGIMVEVAEHAFNDRNFNSVAIYLEKLMMTLSSSGINGYVILKPVMPRIEKLTIIPH